MSRPRVLLCSDYLPPSDGGVEQVVQTLAECLDDRGVDVAVFSLSSGDRPTLADHDSIELYEADTVDLTGTIGLQSTVSVEALLTFRTVLSEFDPDVVHVHNRFFFTSYVAGLLYGTRCDAPVVTTLHLGNVEEIDGAGGYAARLFERSLGRLLLRQSDHVVAVSEAVADHGESLGVPAGKLTVVRNAVAVPDFPHSPPDGKDVVFIGRLVQNNGPVEFLRASRTVFDAHPDARFHFVGTGPLEDELKATASELGVDESVTFHGFVDDIRDAYELADVFCRPSYSEGLPLTVLEAMASGVPPVVSEIAGVPEVVDDRETGVLLPPGDVGAISEGLCWLLDDEARVEELSETAREYAEAELSWERRVRQVLSVYDSVLEA